MVNLRYGSENLSVQRDFPRLLSDSNSDWYSSVRALHLSHDPAHHNFNVGWPPSGSCYIRRIKSALEPKSFFSILYRTWGQFHSVCRHDDWVHLPPIHMYIMDNPWSHYFIELPLYLIVPYLFYFNLIEPKLTGRRVSTGSSCLILWLMMVPETLTGFFIYISKASAYQNMYEINDQRMGGTIMWSGGMIIDTVWILLAVYHWYKSEELKNE